jgi:CBS domain containing-hemolysin-like protein
MPVFYFYFVVALLGAFYALLGGVVFAARTVYRPQHGEMASQALELLDLDREFILRAARALRILAVLVAGAVAGSLHGYAPTIACYVLFGLVASLGGNMLRAKVYALPPNEALRSLNFPLQLVRRLKLLRWLFGLEVKFFNKLGLELPIETEEEFSPQEIRRLVIAGHQEGEIESDERAMIEGVFRFSNRAVSEVMTPRNEIVAISLSATMAEVKELFAEHKHSRVLIIGEDLDDYRGLLLAKDLLEYLGEPGTVPEFDIARIMRSVPDVSAAMTLDGVFEMLRLNAVHLAVVKDDNGGVQGIVTLEDLVEEIVGEIADEHDGPSENGSPLKLRGGALLLDGMTTIRDLRDRHGISLPRGAYSTVAGFIVHRLGELPEVGTVIEVKQVRLRVEEVDSNRISLVKAEKIARK